MSVQPTRAPARRRARLRPLVVGLGATLAVAACSAGDASDDVRATPSTVNASAFPSSSGPDSAGTTPTSSSEGDHAGSTSTRGAAVQPQGPSATMQTLREAPFVGAVVYPHPGYVGNPWSDWGQGLLLHDGRLLTAIGDHLGADGNSYLYVYDPERRTITQFADVLGNVEHTDGDWGYGKVHGQIVDGGDGDAYFVTYYGATRGLHYGGSYTGDWLFRIDSETLELEPITVPVPQHGVPSLASDGRGRIFGEAVDPLQPEGVYPSGGFFVFDTATRSVELFAEDPGHDGFRNVLVDGEGTAWFAHEDGRLFRWRPGSPAPELTDVDLGGLLRASTRPTSTGTVYGVTFEPYDFFAFEPGGSVRTLGRAVWYPASLALLPDESGFLYVPGAHGDSALVNSPLIAVNGTTGEQTTIVELEDLVSEQLHLVLGGTYSIVVDAERNLAYVTFNAGPTMDEPWGEVVLIAVELP